MSFEVTVSFNGSSFALSFLPSWTIAQLKNEISRHQNVNSREIKIIFAGQELPDNWKLEDCNMNHSVIHAVQKKGGQLTAQLSQNETGTIPILINVQLASEDNAQLHDNASSSGSYFFVFCKSCKQVTRGKLRCRCSLCKNRSFVLAQGPNCWDDVLTKGKIQGQCESNSTCDGTTAEFFFKCGEHRGDDEQAPLPMVKSNIKNVPCLTCTDIKEILLIFPCNSQHTMCLDCFQSYCTISLDSRSFVQTETEGYTIPCPGNSDGCRSAFISEPHHFRLLGNEQYERYQRFATEQCVLDAGGVLCPGPGCGQGIFPPQGMRRIICEHGCGLVFCRECLSEYHNGSCDGPSGGATASGNATLPAVHRRQAQITPESDEVARWENEARNLIRNTTKQCPNTKCGVRIEKNAGCNHMTCSRCKFDWCWICCKQWNTKCQSNHWFQS